MTDPKRTCGNCDYWCAKGASSGTPWNPPAQTCTGAVPQKLFDAVVVEKQAATVREWLLMRRNLWQRICNTVPWEGK